MQPNLDPAKPVTNDKLMAGLRLAQEPMAQIMAHGATEQDEYIVCRLDRAIFRLQALRAMVTFRQLLRG